MLCCHLTHVMPQISRSTRSSDASPPAEGQPPASSRVQGACKSARNCNTRDLGEAQNKALVAPRHGSRPVNATPPATSPPARCACRNRPFPRPFPIRWTLRAPWRSWARGCRQKILLPPSFWALWKTGFHVAWRVALGSLQRPDYCVGPNWWGSLGCQRWGTAPHLIKDLGRCATSPLCFRSRHRETSTGMVNALRRTHT